MVKKIPIWTDVSLNMAEDMLRNGSDYKQVSEVLNIKIDYIREKNSKLWHIDMKHFWSEEELDNLTKYYSEFLNCDLIKIYFHKRSEDSLQSKALKMGLEKQIRKMSKNYTTKFIKEVISKKIDWEKWEDDLLKENFNKFSNEYISDNIIIYRSIHGIQGRASSLGLSKDRDTINKSISESHKGKVFSEESKKKMSDTVKEKFKNKENHPMYNKKHTEQSKKKMSMSAIDLNRFGENNPMYLKRGILSPHYKIDKNESQRKSLIRGSIEYKEWRDTVFQNNKYTCQFCGDNKGGNLQAHHIENFSSHEELRFKIDNGITLCEKCHKLFHDEYGYRENTRGQLEEWMCKGVAI